jgi:hypothetical protein
LITTNPPDYFAGLDIRLINIFSTFYPYLIPQQINFYVSNFTVIQVVFYLIISFLIFFLFFKINGSFLIENITVSMWNENCDASNDYFSYLEDLLVIENSSFVALER